MNEEKLIDGRKLAQEHEQQLKELLQQLSIKPHVVSILVGEDPASQLYTNIKQKKAQELGIEFEVKRFPLETPFETIVHVIFQLNEMPEINGIMVQLPLPKEFLGEHSTDEVLAAINPKKDFDGLGSKSPVLSATVRGILSILESEKALGSRKHFVIVGGVHGMVGTSLVEALKVRGEDVIGISRSDPQLSEKTHDADILISAVGQKNLITREMVKPGAIIIDVGQDVDFENVQQVASRMTPPKGGVGPMTIISLMENAVKIVQTRLS